MADAPVDLLVRGADMVATMDDDRREIAGGWVGVTDGFVSGVGGPGDSMPDAVTVLEAGDCLVTPGLVNTHHHIYQNLTRAYRPATVASLFDWLTALYPLWSRLDEEAAYVSAWIGLAELALGGCTTSTDHLYVHPRGGGDLISAEIRAAVELGMRFHPTRGSMSLSQKDGGLPPDSVVQDDDEILADSERLVAVHHDRAPGAMVRIALAPCSPFSVTSELMVRTAELAERLDVRLHTHLAEDADEDRFAAQHFGCRTIDHFESVGWMTDRSWVAYCIYPNDEEVARLGRAGVGVAHCPSSNMMIGGGGIAPVAAMRVAGSPVGLGCDGSSSTDSASLWMEARNAMLLGRLRGGPASTGARRTRSRSRPAGARDVSAAPVSWASCRSEQWAISSCGRWRATSCTPERSAIPSKRGCAAVRVERATPSSRAGSWCATARSSTIGSRRCCAGTDRSPSGSRSSDADRDAALRHLDEALGITDRLGMKRLRDEAAALRSGIE